MTEYGSRDPRRFLDGWLDRLLWRFGIVRRGEYTKLASAYDDVFTWWSKLVREQLAKEELVETIEDDLIVAYVVEKKSEQETFTDPAQGDSPEPGEKS